MTRRALAATVLVALLLAGCSTGGDDDAGPSTTTAPDEQAPTTTGPIGSGPPPIVDALRIEVVSSQPDRISGDDARIRVTPGPGQELGDIRLRLGDRDVTAQLREVDDALEGVVTGIVEGTSTLTATAGDEEAIQRLRAWPLAGPMISGRIRRARVCSRSVA